MDGPSDFLQATDFLKHCLALDIHSTSLKEEEHTFNANAGKTSESPRWDKVNVISISQGNHYYSSAVDLPHRVFKGFVRNISLFIFWG